MTNLLNNYKLLPRRVMISVFTDLFKILPELIEELTPQGWEKSVYHALFHLNAREYFFEKLYYKVIDHNFEVQFGTDSRIQKTGVLSDNPSEEEIWEWLNAIGPIKAHYKKEPYSPELELASLLSETLVFISSCLYFQSKDSDLWLEVHPEVAGNAAAIVARDLEIFEGSSNMQFSKIYWYKRMLIHNVKWLPLMKIIIRAFQKTEYSLVYVDTELLHIIDEHLHADHEAPNKIPNYKNKEHYRLGITSDPDMDEVFDNTARELPSEAVVAYFDVYGDWPTGYQPTKEEYLAWYNKLKGKG